MTHRWGILAALVTARLALGFQFQLVAAVAPVLQDDLGISFADIGFLIGLYMLPGIVLALPAGWLGQRFGDKRLVLLGFALMGLAGILMSLVADYRLLMLGRVIGGVGAVLLNLLMTKMLTDWFAGGPDMVVAMGVFVNSWPVGVALGMVVLGAVGEYQDWQTAALVSGLYALVGFAIMAIIYRPPPAVPMGGTGGGMSRAEIVGAASAGSVWSLYNGAFTVLISFAPAYLIARGYSTIEAGSVASLFLWTSCVSVPLGGVLARQGLTVSQAIIGSLVVWAALLVLLPLLPWSFAVLLAMGFVGGLPAGAIMSLPSRVLRPQSRAMGMGIFYSLFYVSQALSPPLGGLARDFTGAAVAPIMVSLVLVIAALAAYALFGVITREGK